RNAEAARESQRASERAAAVLRDQFAELQGFQARLIVYLQQITAYVDTRDRESAGGSLVLNAALSALAENLDKRSESMAARESRLDARNVEIAAMLEDVRALAAVSQQSSLTLKRELERFLASPASTVAQAHATPAAVHETPQVFAPALDAYKYVG